MNGKRLKSLDALAKFFPSPDFVIMSGYTLICWLILWYLYRKGTFLKV